MNHIDMIIFCHIVIVVVVIIITVYQINFNFQEIAVIMYFQNLIEYSVKNIKFIATELKHTNHFAWSENSWFCIVLSRTELLNKLISNEICDFSLFKINISSHMIVLTNMMFDEEKQHQNSHCDASFLNQTQLRNQIKFSVVKKILCFDQKLMWKMFWHSWFDSEEWWYSMNNFRKEVEILK